MAVATVGRHGDPSRLRRGTTHRGRPSWPGGRDLIDWASRQRGQARQFRLEFGRDLQVHEAKVGGTEGPRGDGVFLAFAEGQTYAPVLMAVDPLGISNLTTRFAFFGGEEVAFVSFDPLNSGLW